MVWFAATGVRSLRQPTSEVETIMARDTVAALRADLTALQAQVAALPATGTSSDQADIEAITTKLDGLMQSVKELDDRLNSASTSTQANAEALDLLDDRVRALEEPGTEEGDAPDLASRVQTLEELVNGLGDLPERLRQAARHPGRNA